jgi:predicted ATPase
VLTIHDAITETREQRKLPDFDDTYYDLVKCLRIKTTSGNVPEELKGVSKTLERVFKGKIVQQFENGKYDFIYKNGNQKYAMPQTAEGIKKIGILTTLINNRMLNNDTILFVDEPETALHPKAQRELVRILQKISQLSGAQVFIATHSYYIINQLHVVAMENKQMVPCISIVTNDKQEKSYDYYDLQKLMPNISIMKEALEMQSEELELIFKMNKQHPNSDKFSEEWN